MYGERIIISAFAQRCLTANPSTWIIKKVTHRYASLSCNNRHNIWPVTLSVSAPPMRIVYNKSAAEWTSVTHCKRQENTFFPFWMNHWFWMVEWTTEKLAHSKTVRPICFVPEWILSELGEWFKYFLTPYCKTQTKGLFQYLHLQKYTAKIQQRINEWKMHHQLAFFFFLVDTRCAS